MDPNDKVKKAADLVSDNAKQLVTVASGILTFTVTFYERLIAGKNVLHRSIWFLVGAWAAYLVSIWYGFKTVDAMTTRLQEPREGFTVYDRLITEPAKRQRRLFLFGTLQVLLFGAIVVWYR